MNNTQTKTISQMMPLDMRVEFFRRVLYGKGWTGKRIISAAAPKAKPVGKVNVAL